MLGFYCAKRSTVTEYSETVSDSHNHPNGVAGAPLGRFEAQRLIPFTTPRPASMRRNGDHWPRRTGGRIRHAEQAHELQKHLRGGRSAINKTIPVWPFLDPQSNPQNAMSCATSACLGSPAVLYVIEKTSPAALS